jgi:Flp pilus assembly protein TadD
MQFQGTLAPQTINRLLGLVLLLSFALYANCLFNGFVYDDHSQIERNPLVHSFKYTGTLFGTSLLAQQGKQAVPNFYRPLTNFSFLLGYELFGLSPLGFHLVNILLHCIVVWLVFFLGSALFGSETLGLLSALVFALHPVHVEPVAWIDGVGDPLMTVFLLFSFWFFLRLGKPEVPRQGLVFIGLLGTFALALFTKETAIVFPVLVTVFEHFFRADRRQTRLSQKLLRYGPVLLTLFAYLVVRIVSVGRLIPARLHTEISPVEGYLSAFALIGQYARKIVWPTPLILFYPFQKSTSLSDPQVLIGLGVCAGLFVLFLFLWKREPLYSFALLWMVLSIVPTLNARWMTASVFAERYLYLSSVGFSWLSAGALLWMWQKSAFHPRAARWGIISACALLALLAGRATLLRTFDWRSDRSLVVSTLAVLPDSPHMHVEYGMFKWAEGDHAGAEREWHLALSYKPDSVEAMAYLGFAKLEENQYTEGIPYLQKAIELKPRFAAPHVYLAEIYAAQGTPEAAETEFLRALEIHPTDTAALNALGQFYLDQGRLDEAARQFRTSVEIYSELSAWSALGKIYNSQEVSDKAEEAWRHVLEFEHFSPSAHRSLGLIYLSRQQWKAAQGEFQACLLMDPADPVALAGLKKIQNFSRAQTLPSSKN